MADTFQHIIHLQTPIARALIWINFPVALLCTLLGFAGYLLSVPQSVLDWLPGPVFSVLWLTASIPLLLVGSRWEDDTEFRHKVTTAVCRW